MKALETLEFARRHSYLAGRIGIEVPISLTAADGTVRLIAKLDTGADFCIFQRASGEQLGLNVDSGQPQKISTATGLFVAFGHSIRLSCFDWTFETVVHFAATDEFRRNVVGRQGWLQNFRVGRP